MNLSDALKQPGAPSITAIAKALDVTPTTVSEWHTGRRPIPIAHCARLECLFEGRLTRRDLRPRDWHVIWPELKDPAAKTHP